MHKRWILGRFKKKVWNELDDDNSGTVSLMELDPPAAKALLEFRDMMVLRLRLRFRNLGLFS